MQLLLSMTIKGHRPSDPGDWHYERFFELAYVSKQSGSRGYTKKDPGRNGLGAKAASLKLPVSALPTTIACSREQ